MNENHRRHQESGFEKITFIKDQERILQAIDGKSIFVYSMANPQNRCECRLRILNGSRMQLDCEQKTDFLLLSDLGRKGNIEFLVPTPDGQCLVRTLGAISPVEGTFGIDLGSEFEIFRLQRRGNFRVYPPQRLNIKFSLHPNATSKKGTTGNHLKPLAVVDLSASGIRIQWMAEILAPQEGDEIEGELFLPGGKSISCKMVVRALHADAQRPLELGCQFQGLSMQEEQTVLFVCMQILRESLPLK